MRKYGKHWPTVCGKNFKCRVFFNTTDWFVFHELLCSLCMLSSRKSMHNALLVEDSQIDKYPRNAVDYTADKPDYAPRRNIHSDSPSTALLNLCTRSITAFLQPSDTTLDSLILSLQILRIEWNRVFSNRELFLRSDVWLLTVFDNYNVRFNLVQCYLSLITNRRQM